LRKVNNLSRNILLALILGSLIGTFLPGMAPYVSWMGLLFKLSLQMIVMPIVLTSILCGLESIGDIRLLKGLGKRAILYFFSTTFVAIIVGLLLVTTIEPGVRPPSSKIVNIINNITGDSSVDIGQKIKLELDEAKLFSNKPKEQALVNEQIDILGQKFSDQSEMKEQVLRYLGALELRSKLSMKAAKPISSPNYQQFFEDQLKNALKNPFEALANQHVLAVIVFTILFGAAMTTIGPSGKKFFEVNRAMNLAVSKIIGLIMRIAPFGVFGLLVSVISATGPEVFRELFWYALCVVIGLSFHLFIFLPLLNYYFTRQNPFLLINKLKPVLLVAFSTSSSNATLPVTMKTMEESFHIDKRVSRFVLPLGATVNMNGTALYEAVAAVFIAQIYGVSLGFSSQAIIALTAAFAAVGTAGIPAAGTVTMALILSAAGLPMEGIGLLFALDRPLDMCRTAVNVAGDAIGCTILNDYFKKQPEQIADSKEDYSGKE
jgi:Na+/H+-dicarboxylate symporter